MENPAAEITDVILTLCTKPAADQQAAVARYFTPDAEFVHPLCRVPPYACRYACSRSAVAAVFRWYKIMSPRVALGVESVAWDRASGTLFVALHQRFALWCVPLYAAHVRLVTELRLVPGRDDKDKKDTTLYYIARQEDHYQINDVLKFFSMGVGAFLWSLVQLSAALVCVGGASAVDALLGLLGQLVQLGHGLSGRAVTK